ncbi:MAG: DMT family transporter [Alphaproteobacteria bacterium]|nr:DMT family transporter [Alphaproteobacteria bacterium]
MKSHVKGAYDNPVLLLIGTGATLGLNFPFGKLAVAAGIAPPLWAAFISMGAGLTLMAVAAASEPRLALNGRVLRFGLLSGFLSYVMPNLLTFTVIPQIGSGLASLMFALSPVTTALLSLVMQVRPPNRLGLAGIGLGLLGAMVIVWGKNSGAGGGFSGWLLLALAVPVFLAIGNVYRTMAWPQGAGPRTLGSLTNLAAVPFLLVIALALNGGLELAPFARVPWLLVAQLASSTMMFAMFFRLQQIGGPTYLSQIGYVAAAVGLVIGVSLLGESYPAAVWAGVAIIALGIGLSTVSARRPKQAALND